jgi:hypothetical protein
MKNEEPSFLIPKSFDDILLNFALVITENRSPQHHLLSKAFPLWLEELPRYTHLLLKSFRRRPLLPN